MHIWNRFLHQLAGQLKRAENIIRQRIKRRGDQSNEEDRKMLYKQRTVLATI